MLNNMATPNVIGFHVLLSNKNNYLIHPLIFGGT